MPNRITSIFFMGGLFIIDIIPNEAPRHGIFDGVFPVQIDPCVLSDAIILGSGFIDPYDIQPAASYCVFTEHFLPQVGRMLLTGVVKAGLVCTDQK